MEFDWDIGNVFKISKRFSLVEIEEFFLQELFVIPDDLHSNIEKRLIAIGRGPNNRPMFVCYTMRKHKIRVISARFMRVKEIKKYEEFKEKTKN